MLSEVFYSLVVTSGIGLIMGLAKLAYNSKCSECNCLCIRIKRDVIIEEKETEFKIDHKQQKSLEELNV